ncbi:hypothetical protein CEXT_399021 [Caerostris extrusa]|uniref:Uncharacterized protein n=1 Tax=Caerostris extrusa TaxID=172846 RepID=A0AAV4Y668_CAEEX|nr:hypothetical protein CEXT_399021 [Caerostris extrusa]
MKVHLVYSSLSLYFLPGLVKQFQVPPAVQAKSHKRLQATGDEPQKPVLLLNEAAAKLALKVRTAIGGYFSRKTTKVAPLQDLYI